MRLHLADIHLMRARLFFRTQTYPWKTPHDDLKSAERLIEGCAYRRSEPVLTDLRQVMSGLG